LPQLKERTSNDIYKERQTGKLREKPVANDPIVLLRAVEKKQSSNEKPLQNTRRAETYAGSCCVESVDDDSMVETRAAGCVVEDARGVKLENPGARL